MNLVKTLAKVAVGMMVSRGVGKMMGGGSSQGSSSSKGGLGGLLGGLVSGASRSGGGGGGLAGMLGSVLSGGSQGGQANQGGASGGLGGLLNSLGGGGGQASGSSGGLGQSGLGGLLNQMMGEEQRAPEPTQEQNTQAEIMLRAMINSAKSDGGVDESEQRKILEHLGDVSQDEVAFVKSEMAKPLDVDGFIRSVPKGLEQQVYVMSLLGIDLDSKEEAQYLDRLANGLGISNQVSNQIHEKVGVPTLYG